MFANVSARRVLVPVLSAMLKPGAIATSKCMLRETTFCMCVHVGGGGGKHGVITAIKRSRMAL